MKRTAFFCAALIVMILPCISTRAEEDETGLSELLQNLESDKRIRDAYSEKEPEPPPPADVRPPSEIIQEVSQCMDTVVKELDAVPHNREGIVENQKKIVDLLDSLLDQAAASIPQSSSTGQSQQKTPLFTQIRLPEGNSGGDSTNMGGGDKNDTSVPDRDPGGAGGPQWGNLPDNVREEILQLLQEDIPVLYRELLRLYFKNISEE